MPRVKPTNVNPLDDTGATVADGTYGLAVVGGVVTGLDASAGGSALDDLTDVDTTGVTDGDSLVYDSGSGLWVPGAVSGGGAADLWTPNVDVPLDTMTGLGSVGSGTWTIVSGVLNQSNASASDANIGWGTETQVASGIVAAEVETRRNSGSGSLQRMGIYVAGPASGATSSYALVYLKTSDGTNWVVCEERAGVAVVLTSSGFTRSAGAWMRVSVMTTLRGINMYVDGTLMGTVAFGSNPGTIGTRVRLYATNVNADFRNLKTWDNAMNLVDPPF